MGFRFRSLVAALPVVLASAMCALSAGCDGELGPPQCAIQEMPLAGTPLTLLSTARLDRSGTGMVLIGSDSGGQTVRFARLSTTGQLGTEFQAAVPAHIGGPWFAVAGSASAGDRVVIAYVVGPPAASAGVQADLMTFAVLLDGTAVAEPVSIAKVPDPRTSPLRVSMGSGRAGMQAGITWAVQGATAISARVLNGDGMPAGAQATLAMVDDFDCLRFSPGKQDMTIGYVDLSGLPPKLTFMGFEISEAGAVQPYFSVRIGTEMPGCVELAPTDTGYALAWHNRIGTYLGVYSPPNVESNLVVGDVRIPDGPPVVGGVGWMGKDYVLVFDRTTGAEAWRLDLRGQRKGGGLVFPSLRGHVGRLSTQPVGSLLYGTYADYSSADPSNETEGQRFLVSLGCP
jgi:hypothetical protein